MGGTLVELYSHLEEKLGKDTAKLLIEAIEELTEEKKNTLKFELKEELLKEVATKEDIKLILEKMQTLEERMEKRIEQVKNELLKWLIVLFVGQATFIVGLVFTLVKILK
ncbi:MAG: hypothetical protein ABGX24_00320 [Aquificota bacterium]